ncbi:hypothetical protein EYF80_030873 [Liparis tanakae]|uniref:Uncharacterized protein n=1 Tax=Liparis tanakae TaxID=230148 RepID=A0A4Z2H0E7_9TELE|nr:hypothetical protein EYF80_030873 [Liparis tanakae]
MERAVTFSVCDCGIGSVSHQLDHRGEVRPSLRLLADVHRLVRREGGRRSGPVAVGVARVSVLTAAVVLVAVTLRHEENARI